MRFTDENGRLLVRITRGDPPEPEPAEDAARRILDAGGVTVEQHEGELDGYVFAILDGDLRFRVVANSHGRGLVCNCGTAISSAGRCPHLTAVRAWFRRERFPDPPPPGPGEPPRPPVPFVLVGDSVTGPRDETGELIFPEGYSQGLSERITLRRFPKPAPRPFGIW